LFLADVYSGHIERSLSLAVLALSIGLVGLGFDLWARSSPGKFSQMVNTRKHSVALNILFFATMAALVAAPMYFVFFEPQWNWPREAFSTGRVVFLIVSYNLVVASVRYLRIRGNESTNSKKN
jgi:hypothetical protein